MLVGRIGLASRSGGHFLLASAYRPEMIRMIVAVRKFQADQGARKTDGGKTCILILTCFKTRTDYCTRSRACNSSAVACPTLRSESVSLISAFLSLLGVDLGDNSSEQRL